MLTQETDRLDTLALASQRVLVEKEMPALANARASIEAKIAAGDHYDAQQLAKSLLSRMRVKGQQREAAHFCVEAARMLALAGKPELALDLGRDLVDAFEASRSPPSDENLQLIERLLADVPLEAAAGQKYVLLQRALRWSAGSSDADAGHPRLHRLAATSYSAQGQYGKCQSHLVYCGEGPALANMVHEWSKHGHPNEEPLFALRTLLILLTLDDKVTAKAFWSSVLAASGAQPLALYLEAKLPAGAPPEEIPEPPLQCGSLLLSAVEAKNYAFFKTVRQKYTLVTRRDPAFDKYLAQIETRVFGGQRPAGAGGLGSIFEALLGGALH